MPKLLQDESGYLQLDITGYPEDFNISFNVTGTFLGFSKISAKVVTAKEKTVQVLFYYRGVYFLEKSFYPFLKIIFCFWVLFTLGNEIIFMGK